MKEVGWEQVKVGDKILLLKERKRYVYVKDRNPIINKLTGTGYVYGLDEKGKVDWVSVNSKTKVFLLSDEEAMLYQL